MDFAHFMGCALAIPVGVAFFAFGMMGLRSRKDDANPAATDDVYNPSSFGD
jgi:hypothetical protein